MTQTLLSTEEFFDFSEALRRMRQGKKVRRAGWILEPNYYNGYKEDRFLYAKIVSTADYPSHYKPVQDYEPGDEHLIFVFKNEGEVPQPFQIRTIHILAKDWYEVE